MLGDFLFDDVLLEFNYLAHPVEGMCVGLVVHEGQAVYILACDCLKFSNLRQDLRWHALASRVYEIVVAFENVLDRYTIGIIS